MEKTIHSKKIQSIYLRNAAYILSGILILMVFIFLMHTNSSLKQTTNSTLRIYNNTKQATHNGPVNTYAPVSSLPFVEPYNVQYLGAFAVPVTAPGCPEYDYNCTFSYGGQVIAYDPYNNGIFLSSHIYSQWVAEVTIPPPVKGNNLSKLNIASFIQNFSDITEGHRFNTGYQSSEDDLCINSSYSNLVTIQTSCGSSSYVYTFVSSDINEYIRINNGTGFTPGIYKIVGLQGDSAVLNTSAGTAGSNGGSWHGIDLYDNPSGDDLGGLIVYKHELIGDIYGYYDAAYTVAYSHFTSGLTLGTNFSAIYNVAPQVNPGYVAGPMTYVPLQYASMLKGNVLTGQLGLAITSRSSWGPAAFAFNPANFTSPFNSVPATALLYYNSAHPTLGTWGNGGGYENLSLFNQATASGGMVLVPGTQSLLFLQRNGIGPTCYGIGTTNMTLLHEGTDPSNGDSYCYDPDQSSKGTHAYPYVYQILAYNVSELAQVANGTLEPWQPVPYAVWDLPNATATTASFSATFDNATNSIYISIQGADSEQAYDANPLIKVYQINMSATASPGYYLGGTVGEATGPLQLQVNGGDTLNVSGDGFFEFPNKIANGAQVTVSVLTPPTGHVCTVRNGQTTIQDSNYINVFVSCLQNATVNNTTSTTSTITTTSSTSSTSTSSTSSTITSTTTANTSPTTGSSSSGGGGGGAPGGGGSEKPSVTELSNGCYQITNITSPDYAVVNINSSSFYVRENFISPTDTGITINNQTHYTLSLNSNYSISKNSRYNYTISLKRISYLPIIQTVVLEICAVPVQNVTTITKPLIIKTQNETAKLNVSISVPTKINFTSYGTVISVSSGISPTISNSSTNRQNISKAKIQLSIKNVSNPAIPLPVHYNKITILNITINSTNKTIILSKINASISYNCSIPSDRIQPFIYQNNTWEVITRFSINSTACTTSISIPSDPIVGLFELQPITGTSHTSNSTTTETSTVPTTTINQQSASNGNKEEYTIIGIIGIIAIIVIIILLYLINRGGKGDKKPENKVNEVNAVSHDHSTASVEKPAENKHNNENKPAEHVPDYNSDNQDADNK